MARFNREDAKTVLPQLEKRIDNNTKEILDKIASLTDFFYPVGTVYETLDGKFNPNKAWGGKWDRIKGKTLVGVDEDDTDFATSGNEGGSKGAWKHSHGNTQSGSNLMAYVGSGGNFGGSGSKLFGVGGVAIYDNGSDNNTLNVDIANMPPYITVYMWRRTK